MPRVGDPNPMTAALQQVRLYLEDIRETCAHDDTTRRKAAFALAWLDEHEIPAGDLPEDEPPTPSARRPPPHDR